MFLKYSQTSESTLVLNKIAKLLEKFNIAFQQGTYQTQEEVIEEFQRVMDIYYSTLMQPTLTLVPVAAGTRPDAKLYNTCFTNIGVDLEVLFNELANLEEIVVKNFDYTLSERDKVNKLVKRIDSKLGDYALYAARPMGSLLYFRDSFNDLSKIDTASKLMKEKLCNVDTVQGVVTLPMSTSDQPIKRSATIVVNQENSNGSLGNFSVPGASPRNRLADVLDANPDTWIEYEKVVSRIEGDATWAPPLKLDITISFTKPEVINHIRINPNNFGTLTQIQVEQIDTSYDGKTWVSVKDDIPITGYLQEDESNIFTLAPSTSKYAGQGMYTFTPRKAKLVHILFKQKTPYVIQTASGTKLRYAIGIRDIEVKAVKYEPKGELISTPFISVSEVKKVALLASENPSEASELADITHQVSPNDNGSWYDISPQDRSTLNVPEVLYFNTADANSITTASPVYSIRHRMLLTRDASKFKTGSSTLALSTKTGSDICGIPTLSPGYISLTRPPVAGTLVVAQPLYGIRCIDGDRILRKDAAGKDEVVSPYIRPIGYSMGEPAQQFYGVLSAELKAADLTVDDVHIWIDNIMWENVAIETLDSQDEDANVYSLTSQGVLHFGGGATGSGGRIPPQGSLIGYTLSIEALQFTGVAPYVTTLKLPSDGSKSNTFIYAADGSLVNEADWDFDASNDRTFRTIILKNKYARANATTTVGSPAPSDGTMALDNETIVPGTVVLGSDFFGGGVTSQEVGFIDGSTELKANAQYSVDYAAGILYYYVASGSAHPQVGQTVQYAYTNYTISYNVSKILPETMYELDIPNKRITISEDVIAGLWIDRNSNLKYSSLLRVTYDYVDTTRESIEELEPFFSPIVRDVTLKMVPQEIE